MTSASGICAKSATRRHSIPEWETLRDLASGIKEHTLSHLSDYLEQFAAAATANGVHVHWAATRRSTTNSSSIMSERGTTTLVKSKSMLTDECAMRDYLEPRGITVMETDLGERIQQLDHQDPSHMVVPAVHKLRGDVARCFGRTIGTDPGNSDIHYLAESQRMNTRPYFVRGRRRHDGRQFRGGGNGHGRRLHQRGQCRSVGECAAAAYRLDRHREADSAGERPRRVHPHAVAQRAGLADHAIYVAFPRAASGHEMHFMLVDHGRSERLGDAGLLDSLKCIRCGACMNTCPVYRRSGGLVYGGTYSGPIGAIINPTFDLKRYSALPFASTLNGSCTNVCPVKINIHEQIYKWREVITDATSAVREKDRDGGGRCVARQPAALPYGDRDGGSGPARSAALCAIQCPERLGEGPRKSACIPGRASMPGRQNRQKPKTSKGIKTHEQPGCYFARSEPTARRPAILPDVPLFDEGRER